MKTAENVEGEAKNDESEMSKAETVEGEVINVVKYSTTGNVESEMIAAEIRQCRGWWPQPKLSRVVKGETHWCHQTGTAREALSLFVSLQLACVKQE